jgi:hypothetical protein
MQPHRLTCRFEPPEHGWLGLRLERLPDVVTFTASHTPCDSVSELAGVLLRVLRFGVAGEVAWNEEPTVTVTAFELDGDRVRLRVLAVPQGRRAMLLEHDDTVHSVATAFVSGLHRLDADCAEGQYEAGWGHPFPRDAVAQLYRLLDGAGE